MTDLPPEDPGTDEPHPFDLDEYFEPREEGPTATVYGIPALSLDSKTGKPDMDFDSGDTTRLVPCLACGRHIALSEAVCTFCGAGFA